VVSHQGLEPLDHLVITVVADDGLDGVGVRDVGSDGQDADTRGDQLLDIAQENDAIAREFNTTTALIRLCGSTPITTLATVVSFARCS